MTTLLRFLFSAIGLLVACSFVPGLGHGSFLDLLIVAVILGALMVVLIVAESRKGAGKP